MGWDRLLGLRLPSSLLFGGCFLPAANARAVGKMLEGTNYFSGNGVGRYFMGYTAEIILRQYFMGYTVEIV
jgi:hypothetical protein